MTTENPAADQNALPTLDAGQVKRALHIQANLQGPAYLRMILPSAAINWAHEIPWEAGSVGIVRTELFDDLDLVVGQQVADGPMTTLWEAATNHGGPATAYETDDLLLEVPRSNPASAFYNKPATQKGIREAIQRSDAVIVSTEPLGDELRPLNPNVYVIPNHVNEEVIRETPREPEADSPVVIGWAGSSTHRHDLATVEHALARVLRQLGDRAEIHLMGMDYRSLFDNRGRFTPWVGDVEDYLLSLEFDIGLCPLEDNRFNRCKSALKALDYASQGIPVLAPAVTPYREYVAHGEWGLLYRDQNEFRSHLLDLINDAGLRYEMGVKGIAFAHTQSEQARIHERVAIYDEIVGSSRRGSDASKAGMAGSREPPERPGRL